MRTLMVSVALIACCSALLFSIASAAPEQNATPTQTAGVLSFVLNPTPSAGQGTFDPYVGQNDLVTRAVPVCCCSSSFACDQDPPPPVGTPCKVGTPICKCNGGILCVNMP